MDHAHHHTAKDQAVSGASREQSPARHTPALSLDGGPGGGASSTGASPEPDAPPSPHQLLPRASTSKRLALARRLEVLARQVADGDPEVDERTLTGQVDLLEEALGREPGTRHRRSDGLGPRSLSDQGEALLLSTAGPSHTHTHTRFSSLSASLLASAPEPEPDRTRDAPTRGVSIRRANKVISELTKLNEELTIVVENLRARQEESQHIHGLLIERAENAARRIIFLQDRISYLEQELGENDDELQHLRICLKAVEVQVPPHPDPDIRRCIATFKEDYKALRRKRAGRSSLASANDT